MTKVSEIFNACCESFGNCFKCEEKASCERMSSYTDNATADEIIAMLEEDKEF